MQTNTAPPPVGHWERINQAAARKGIPAPLLLAQIEAGLADIRVAHLGRRGLVHVAAADVDRFADQLAGVRS